MSDDCQHNWSGFPGGYCLKCGVMLDDLYPSMTCDRVCAICEEYPCEMHKGDATDESA